MAIIENEHVSKGVLMPRLVLIIIVSVPVQMFAFAIVGSFFLVRKASFWDGVFLNVCGRKLPPETPIEFQGYLITVLS